MASLPTAADLAAILEPRIKVDPARAAAELELVAALVRNRTRDEGFYRDGTVAPDLRAVILSATARLYLNPSQTQHTITKGPQAASYGVGFAGFTLTEIVAMNRYRRTAL